MAFIKKTSLFSKDKTEMCEAVANLFRHHERNERNEKNIPKNDRTNFRTKPCSNGENCRFLNAVTGEDTCIFANSIDKLQPILCDFDERCNNHKCKRYHAKRGQTIEDYAEKNNFVFPVKQTVIQIENPDVVLDISNISQISGGNSISIKALYQEDFEDLPENIQNEIDEVCDYLNEEKQIEYQKQLFMDEVERLYEDPDEKELLEYLEKVELINKINEMRLYAYEIYGIQV